MGYHEEEKNRVTLELRGVLKELPEFCKEFFIAIASSTQPRTRLAYARDLKVFFNYLVEFNIKFEKIALTDISIEELNNITALDISEYLDFISYYIGSNGLKMTNNERGKARKLSAIRRMFKYFYKVEKIKSNPAELVETPKIMAKDIVRLEPNETVELLEAVEKGERLTDKARSTHAKLANRDVAIVTLLLGTGIRVSECVGIDINHIDFDSNGVKIIRKGGKEVVVYFGKEVEEALKAYLVERENIVPIEGDEDALFLSLKRRRINVRSVQKLVKKYANTITLKNISPHKLRSTYGTALYKETGDIYLVADVLGHEDVNTTKKHYAQMSDENRRKAGRIVKLRED